MFPQKQVWNRIQLFSTHFNFEFCRNTIKTACQKLEMLILLKSYPRFASATVGTWAWLPLCNVAHHF